MELCKVFPALSPHKTPQNGPEMDAKQKLFFGFLTAVLTKN